MNQTTDPASAAIDRSRTSGEVEVLDYNPADREMLRARSRGMTVIGDYCEYFGKSKGLAWRVRMPVPMAPRKGSVMHSKVLYRIDGLPVLLIRFPDGDAIYSRHLESSNIVSIASGTNCLVSRGAKITESALPEGVDFRDDRTLAHHLKLALDAFAKEKSPKTLRDHLIDDIKLYGWKDREFLSKRPEFDNPLQEWGDEANKAYVEHLQAMTDSALFSTYNRMQEIIDSL